MQKRIRQMEIDQSKEYCLVCGSSCLNKLAPVFSRYQRRMVMHVGACEMCGHMQLFPLPVREDVECFNKSFLGTKYSGRDNTQNHRVKLQKLTERIDSLLGPGMNVLDIGAGEGWAMEYLKSKEVDYYAIEAIDELRLSLEGRGARIIASSIYDDLSNYEGMFDLIIFRHILEHLIEPNKALQQIQKLLKKDGFLYLAVPNLMNPDSSKGIVTNFLRPVHVSYFCPENIIRISENNGLNAKSIEADREIFGLLELKKECSSSGSFRNNYPDVVQVFKENRSKAKRVDAKNLLKIVIHRLFVKPWN